MKAKIYYLKELIKESLRASQVCSSCLLSYASKMTSAMPYL